MARHVPGRPDASTVLIRMLPGHSSTDAFASRKAALPAAGSALTRRLNAHVPLVSTRPRRLWATVVTGPRGAWRRTIETSADVSSGSVTTMARGPAEV